MNKITIPILSIEYDSPYRGILKGYNHFGKFIDENPFRCNKCDGKLNHIETLESLMSTIIQDTGISNQIDFKESHYCGSCKSSKDVKSLKIVVDEPVLDFPTLDV